MSGKKVSTPKADSRQKPFLFVALRTFGEKRNKAKPAEAKTTPFRIRNSLVKIFSQYSESPSLSVGLKPVFYEQSNLNLVKNFLTSITFDSLSRKIKNPCLVINLKLIQFKEEIIMYNFKKFFTYLVVGALVMALSISCKSNEEPTDNTHSNHPPSGEYSGTLTIGSSSINTIATVTTSGGTCNIKGTAYNIYDTTDTKQYDITITKWLYSADGNGDYVRAGSISPSGEATINAPKGATDFAVRYIAGSIQLSFNLYDKTYDTAYNMTRQQ